MGNLCGSTRENDTRYNKVVKMQGKGDGGLDPNVYKSIQRPIAKKEDIS